MVKQNNTVCFICGHKCKPRGLGSHMRLKHGIVVKTVVKDLSDSSEKVQRASDWRNKKQKVIDVTLNKANPPAWLEDTLSGIIMPSISKYKAGLLSDRERKELERTALQMGMSVEEYMRDLEQRLQSATPTIRKLFE